MAVVENKLEELLCLDSSLDVISIMQQFRENGFPCRAKKAGLFLKNGGSGEIKSINCHSWECAECRGKQVVKTAYAAISGEPEWLMTVTQVPEDRVQCRRGWQQFVRALRNGYGKYEAKWEKLKSLMSDVASAMGVYVSSTEWSTLRSKVISGFALEYMRVLERGGKSGMRHFHVLIRGEEIPRIVVIGFARLFGFGKVADIRQVYDEGGSWYVAKYLGKSGGEEGWRKVTCSRGYKARKVVDVDPDWRVEHVGGPVPGSTHEIDIVRHRRGNKIVSQIQERKEERLKILREKNEGARNRALRAISEGGK